MGNEQNKSTTKQKSDLFIMIMITDTYLGPNFECRLCGLSYLQHQRRRNFIAEATNHNTPVALNLIELH